MRVWARAWTRACLGGVGWLGGGGCGGGGHETGLLGCSVLCARHRPRRLGKRPENPQAAHTQMDNRGTERSAACHITQRWLLRHMGSGGSSRRRCSPKTRRFVEVQIICRRSGAARPLWWWFVRVQDSSSSVVSLEPRDGRSRAALQRVRRRVDGPMIRRETPHSLEVAGCSAARCKLQGAAR